MGTNAFDAGGGGGSGKGAQESHPPILGKTKRNHRKKKGWQVKQNKTIPPPLPPALAKVWIHYWG